MMSFKLSRNLNSELIQQKVKNKSATVQIVNDFYSILYNVSDEMLTVFRVDLDLFATKSGPLHANEKHFLS